MLSRNRYYVVAFGGASSPPPPSMLYLNRQCLGYDEYRPWHCRGDNLGSGGGPSFGSGGATLLSCFRILDPAEKASVLVPVIYTLPPTASVAPFLGPGPYLLPEVQVWPSRYGSRLIRHASSNQPRGHDSPCGSETFSLSPPCLTKIPRSTEVPSLGRASIRHWIGYLNRSSETSLPALRDGCWRAKKTIMVDKSEVQCTHQLVTGGDRLSGPGYCVLGIGERRH